MDDPATPTASPLDISQPPGRSTRPAGRVDPNGAPMSCRGDAASSALTSYAHACTGMHERDVQRTFHELKREGRRLGAPDPTPAEAEAFLLDQESRVRNDPTLTAVRRRSLLTRLHAALDRVRSRVLPTGPTFHAWRNILSTTWGRVQPRIAPGLAAGVLAASLAACSHNPSNPVATGSTGPTGSPRPTASASPSASPSPAGPGITASSGPGQTFGVSSATKGVQEAYKIAEIALTDQNLLAPRSHSIRDFYALKPYLTPQAWTFLTRQVAAGDPSPHWVGQLAPYDAVGDPFHESGILAKPITFGPYQATVDRSVPNHPRLVVSFSSVAVYQGTIVATGRPGTLTLNRKWTYWLTPSGVPGIPWQVSTWSATSPPATFRPAG